MTPLAQNHVRAQTALLTPAVVFSQDPRLKAASSTKDAGIARQAKFPSNEMMDVPQQDLSSANARKAADANGWGDSLSDKQWCVSLLCHHVQDPAVSAQCNLARGTHTGSHAVVQGHGPDAGPGGAGHVRQPVPGCRGNH